MNNLLKRKAKNLYVKKNTEEEVYQQIHFYKIVVEDRAKAMKKKDQEKLMNRLFTALQDYRLQSTLERIFNPRKYEVSVEISHSGNDCIAKVTITKRRLLKRLIAVFRGCF